MSAVIINVDTALTDVPIIEIGKQGENEATQVVFDVSDMIDTFGSGTAYVVVQRRGDAEPYLLDNAQQSSDKVTWKVSNVDTDVYGMGRVQLFWMIGDQVAKSVNYQFYVEEALGNPTDAPVVPGGWISEKIGDLDELTTTAKENLVAAINEVNALVDEMADDIEGLTGDVETLQAQMETKAEIDGLYEDMTVGNAEQLIASDYVTDKAPYLFRKTGGSTDVGNREYDTLVGASAVWNQLNQFEDSKYDVNSATKSFSGNTATVTRDSSATFGIYLKSAYRFSVTGHKYLFVGIASASLTGSIKYGFDDINTTACVISTANTKVPFATIQSAISDDKAIVLYKLNSTTEGDSFTVSNYACIDLTTLFGSTIADYIYSLEQSTAGSGVAWLRQYFPTLFQYHEYDAGTLKSVEGVESHDMVGFNAWDEQWENGYINNSGNPTSDASSIRSKNFNRCVPNAVYYFEKPSSYAITPNIVWYDANKEFISRSTDVYPPQFLYTSPSNASFFKISCYQYGSAYNHDICINLSNSGYRNGEYEPYWKRSYPLDSTWVGRGIYKLGSDGKPYADGDTYASDGTVTVNYTERAYQSGDESLADAITDGTNTVVKLSTPTTEEYEPFQSPQICDDFGTEEYVTDCLIPVGHETKYPANLRDKVQHLPDLSNTGNGNYIINQTGTQMSLIPTTSIIPAVPTTNGTYKLKCTVSGGVASLTWEVDS